MSRGEVIGLLGGTFDEKNKVLKVGKKKKTTHNVFKVIVNSVLKSLCCAVLMQISVAEPCNSVSTGMQCEMDPVSQTQACDVLSSLGYSVVGWYHSHPTFHPNPSVRDINTQDQFQVA